MGTLLFNKCRISARKFSRNSSIRTSDNVRGKRDKEVKEREVLMKTSGRAFQDRTPVGSRGQSGVSFSQRWPLKVQNNVRAHPVVRIYWSADTAKSRTVRRWGLYSQGWPAILSEKVTAEQEQDGEVGKFSTLRAEQCRNAKGMDNGDDHEAV